MTSREYFESASAAQRRIDAVLASISRMREREGVRAQTYAPVGHGSGASDPMRATDSRIDAEARARAELSSLYSEVESAREVCRGYSAANPRSMGGELIQLHYLDLMSWREASSACGISESKARHECRVALDWIDSVGIASARAGMGAA